MACLRLRHNFRGGYVALLLLVMSKSKSKVLDQPPNHRLNALITAVMADGKHLPCTNLAQWLNQPASACQVRNVPRHNRALLLAGVLYQLGYCLTADIGPQGQIDPDSISNWKKVLIPQPAYIFPSKLVFRQADCGIKLPLVTYQFISTLSADLIINLVAWAPPVVSLDIKKGTAQVLGNVATALIARYAIPSKKIKVRVLETQTLARLSQIDVGQLALGPLQEFVRHHRDRIIAAHPMGTGEYSLAQAALITDLSYSSCSRIRADQNITNREFNHEPIL